MIIRYQYMAYLQKEYADETNLDTVLQGILSSDRDTITDIIRKKECMTVALYRHKNMIFLYYEALKEKIIPQDLFPALMDCLEAVPVKETYKKWLPMHIVYYNAIPDTAEKWCRMINKERIGRIAYLLPDKLVSYLYYHKALLDEGLFEGERYLSIGLHDTILFTYSESPRIITHLNLESKEESAVITKWEEVNPRSHFDHDFSGEGNFVDLQKLVTLGWEEIFNE